MEKSLDDCYYFLYSSCKRGDACSFRHNEETRQNPVLCEEWNRTGMCRLDCPFRHSLYHKEKKRSNDFCYWEGREKGCTREFCEFRHQNPEKDRWKIDRQQNNSMPFQPESAEPMTGGSRTLWGVTLPPDTPLEMSSIRLPNSKSNGISSFSNTIKRPNVTKDGILDTNMLISRMNELDEELADLNRLLDRL